MEISPSQRSSGGESTAPSCNPFGSSSAPISNPFVSLIAPSCNPFGSSSAPSCNPFGSSTATNVFSFRSPTFDFATEWLDENGCVCPKAVDYASQCPKGHPLLPLAGAGCVVSAQRVMCRVCHTFSEREHASQWLECSVPWCCAGYAVCDSCVCALHQAPAAVVAAGEGFSSQVNRAARAA